MDNGDQFMIDKNTTNFLRASGQDKRRPQNEKISGNSVSWSALSYNLNKQHLH